MSVPVASLSLVGGHPSLDLINSVERGEPVAGAAAHEFLSDAAELLVWATRTGLIDEHAADGVARAWRDQPSLGGAALHCARELREALHTLLRVSIGDLPYDADSIAVSMETIHIQWLSSAGRSGLIFAAGTSGAGRIVFGNSPERILQDRIAETVMDGVTNLPLDRVRRCPTHSGGCGWMFLDHSRNGSRRWCRMSDCGTRVKTDRLTERRRADRLASTPHT